MKTLILFLILLSACQPRSVQKENLPDYIMEEFAFALGLSEMKMDDLTDADFEKHKIIINQEFPDESIPKDLSYSSVILRQPTIKIVYIYGSYKDYSKNGKYFEKSCIIHADDEENFTARELIVKINNATLKDLENDPHYFFEGMNLIGYENNIPVYQLMQGS